MTIAYGLMAGLILALQNPINSHLGVVIKSPMKASVINFLIGTVTMVALSFAVGGDLFGNINKVIHSSQPWWIWLGGFFGAIGLTSNIFLFRKVGAILTIVLPTLGMVLMSTVIETFGWMYSKQIPLTTNRIIGIAVLLLGIYIAVVVANTSDQTRQEEEILEKAEGQGQFTFWHVWGVIAGGLVAVQQTLNGHLGVELGSAMQTSAVQFAIGTVAISTFTLVGEKSVFPKMEVIKKIPVWNYLGGVLGSTYVLVMAALVPILGPGLTLALSIIGSVTGAAIIQQFGWFESIKKQIKLVQVVGIIITVFGIILIKSITF